MNLLLLRGLGREAGHWGLWTEQLASLPSVDSVHCMDLAGVGTEWGRTAPKDIAGLAADLEARFEDRGGEWALVAISLGAMVAMDWIRQRRQRFRALVAMNTSAGGVSRRFERVQKYALKEFLRIFALNDNVARETAILELTSNSQASRRQVLPSWVEIAEKRPVSRSVLIGQLWAASRFRAEALVEIPKLFLVSEQDRIVQPSCTKALAEFYGGELYRHPYAGHDLPLDASEWAAEKIDGFLSNL